MHQVAADALVQQHAVRSYLDADDKAAVALLDQVGALAHVPYPKVRGELRQLRADVDAVLASPKACAPRTRAFKVQPPQRCAHGCRIHRRGNRMDRGEEGGEERHEQWTEAEAEGGRSKF